MSTSTNSKDHPADRIERAAHAVRATMADRVPAEPPAAIPAERPGTSNSSSIDAIAERAASTVDLIVGVVDENLDNLVQEIIEMRKVLHVDAERVRQAQSGLLRSAGALMNLQASAKETLSAVRSGRARLVQVADGEL